MLVDTLKLTDPDGRVSLTNVSIYVVLLVVIYSVARSGALDMTALGALLTSLGAQRAKLWQQDKRESREFDKLKAELADWKREASRVQARPVGSAATLPAGLR